MSNRQWAILLVPKDGDPDLKTAYPVDPESGFNPEEEIRHVVPCVQIEGGVDIGVHTLTRLCQCHPQVRDDHNGPVIIHEDRKAS